MTDLEPILVLGATGGQGGAVCEALLRRGAPVRAYVRNPASATAEALSSRGVELAQGTLDDLGSLAAAMRTSTAVFAMTSPFEGGVDAEIEQGRTILAAAAETAVPHLVFSSVAGASSGTSVPHFDSKAVIENELIAGQGPYTILAPTYFFDNALGGQQAIRDGVLQLPLPSDRPLQQVSRTDLGEYAAAVLTNPRPYAGRRVELASDAPTPTQMAQALSGALGRTVVHEQTDPEDIRNPDMLAMWRFLNGPGYQVDIPALHTRDPKLLWTSFSTWAQQAFGH